MTEVGLKREIALLAGEKRFKDLYVDLCLIGYIVLRVCQRECVGLMCARDLAMLCSML